MLSKTLYNFLLTSSFVFYPSHTIGRLHFNTFKQFTKTIVFNSSSSIIDKHEVARKSYLNKSKRCSYSTEPGPKYSDYRSWTQLNTSMNQKEAKSCLDVRFADSVKGMKELNKDAFQFNVKLPCITVEGKDLARAVYLLKRFIVKHRKLTGVLDYDRVNFIGAHEDVEPTSDDQTPQLLPSTMIDMQGRGKFDINTDTKKVILLNPKMIKKYEDFGAINKENLTILKNANVTPESFAFANFRLTYDNFSAEDILKAILPDGMMFSSFTSVGHIVHCNVHDELKEYKGIIAQILLDKVPTCKTVVNKVHSIDNTYRNFEIELLAGENNMVTTQSENGCSFMMDFSKVYWNSRLSTEHARIVQALLPGDTVIDVFAGIGPFSIPAFKRHCIVVANDINPDAYVWLKKNIELNKGKHSLSNITATNKDAKQFIQEDLKGHVLNFIRRDKSPLNKVHIIMNLPAMAVTFVKYLKVLTREEYKQLTQKPVLHLYCFLPKIDLETKEPVRLRSEVAKLFQENDLKFDLSVEPPAGGDMPREREIDEEGFSVKFVRNVAPNKNMYQIVLNLSEEFLVNNKRKGEDEEREKEEGKSETNNVVAEEKKIK